jgi:hypothetical protein
MPFHRSGQNGGKEVVCLDVVDYRMKNDHYHSTFAFVQDLRGMFNSYKE